MTLLIFVIYFIITLYLYLPSYLPYNTVFFLYFLYKKILFYSQRKKLSVKLNQYDQPNLGNTKYTLIDLIFFFGFSIIPDSNSSAKHRGNEIHK